MKQIFGGAYSGFTHTQKLSELQIKDPLGVSFHVDFKNSSYVFVGGLNTKLTEGDLAIVFSQWGEILDIHLVRDRTTGESKGFGFIGFVDQRSTDLAVDNANGMRLTDRTIRVDHVNSYVVPEEKPDSNYVVPSGPYGLGVGVIPQNKTVTHF